MVILTPVLPDVFVLVVVRLNRQSVPGARVEASSDALISRLLHPRGASPLERVLLVALLLLGCCWTRGVLVAGSPRSYVVPPDSFLALDIANAIC